MDKNMSKLIAKSIKVPTPEWILFEKDVNTEPNFNYPYIVKPSSEGSTYGLSIVNNKDELPLALELASKFSKEILIEAYIPGRELTIGILDNQTLPIIEIRPSHNLYDFECK